MGAAAGESLPPWEPNHTDTLCADTELAAAARGVAVMTGAAAAGATKVSTAVTGRVGPGGFALGPAEVVSSAEWVGPASWAAAGEGGSEGGSDDADETACCRSTTTAEADGLTGVGSKAPAEPWRFVVAVLGAGPSTVLRVCDAGFVVFPVGVRPLRAVGRPRAGVPDWAGAEVADESVESVGSAWATAGRAAIAIPTPRATANAPTRPI
jgi:hypothetical protein